MTELEAAWIAGFMSGNGYFTSYRDRGLQMWCTRYVASSTNPDKQEAIKRLAHIGAFSVSEFEKSGKLGVTLQVNNTMLQLLMRKVWEDLTEARRLQYIALHQENYHKNRPTE